MYSVGEIISSNRKKKGLSQVALSDLLQKEGFTQTQKAISKWEQNAAEPSVTIFFTLCRILGVTNMYEAYFGENPDDPLSSLSEEGRKKAMDYIKLLHASGLYEKKLATVIPFYRNIDIFANAVSAGTGNFLVDGPKDTVTITDKDLIPENATFGVRITGDSMEPEFEDGQIAWVLQQETVANGEIGIFSLNGDAYIKKLQDDKNGIFLISLNEKYAPIEIGENDRFDIFGKVVGKSNVSDIPGYKG
jgi:SOS-response transcriptional repressor LexA